MTVEEQLRDYRATLDAATEGRAASHEHRSAPPVRIRPARTFVVAAIAVAASVAIAFAAVGVSHRHSTPPAGTGRPTPTTSTKSPITGGARTVVVPSVLGMTASEARQVLETLGFREAERSAVEGSVGCAARRGAVTEQDPPPRSRAATASTVTVTVCRSLGGELWRDPRLTITPTALGAVRVGMTKSQAENAAGFSFDGLGDGFAYPTRLPAGYPHDFAGLGGPNEKVVCIGAEIVTASTPGSWTQTVSTADGFELGDTVERLLAVYGSRAHFVAAPASGMTTNAGYVVNETDGNLVFAVDQATQRIFEIAGGGSDIGPNSCTG